jgi:hypothetical protein
MRKPELRERIEYLRREKDQPEDETLSIEEEVLDSLRKNRRNAEKDKDWSAVNKANELVGKTQALFADRRLIEQSDPFEAMSSEQLEQTVAGFLRDPLLRGMVRRSLARYEDRSAGDDAEPDEEGGGSLH